MNKSTKKPAPKAGDIQSLKDYCDKFYPADKFPRRKRCPHPGCPENDKYPFDNLGQCTLNKPIWISIPAGEHVHISCPVHPDGHIIYGPDIHFRKPKVTWGPDDFYKMCPDPDYSKMGKVWM